MRLLAFLALPLSVLAADATMFRGDPAHSGIYNSPAPRGLSNVKWKFKTGAKILSSPAVVGGVVYIGSADRSLYAVNAADGVQRWKFATHGAINSSPAVANGLVYVNSLDGTFYAVDAATGTKKWSYKTDGERRFTAPGIHGAMPRTEMMADPYDVFLSSPAVAAGVVYFGSGDNHVYALDAQSGELKWKFKTGDVVHASPAVSGGVVYIGSWDRNLYALDAKTGAMIWKFQTGDDKTIYNQIGIASSASVVDGVIYFGCRDGHFYAVDAKTGKEKWKHNNNMGWVIASPAVRDGLVYFPTSDGTRFKALEAATGKVIFNIANKAVSFSSPALAGDVVFFGSSEGVLHALDAKTGAVKAEFQTDGNQENGPKYIDAQGKMTGLYPDQTLDGMMVGMFRMFTLGSVLSSPVVVDGVVYFGSTDGQLYAIQ